MRRSTTSAQCPESKRSSSWTNRSTPDHGCGLHYITRSECEWIQDAVVVKLDYELTKGFQKSKFHSTSFPKSKQPPTFLSSIQNPLITPHHFLALLSSSNWGTTVPLATPETSCNVRERRPWRMFHSTRTWRGSTTAWPSSTWERSTLASFKWDFFKRNETWMRRCANFLNLSVWQSILES